MLVEARYRPKDREVVLTRINLQLERMRLLLRLALVAQVMPKRGFESASRGVDQAGRMIHGWRQTLSRHKNEPSSR